MKQNTLHKLAANRKKLCPICGEYRKINCFKAGEEGCIICRRKAGKDLYKRIRSCKTDNIIKYKKFKCTNCKKEFISELWGMNNKGHYYLCPVCRSNAEEASNNNDMIEDFNLCI